MLGAGIALVVRVGERTLGLIMAFGSGVLISAIAYDLVADAYRTSGGAGITAGILSGALVFFVGDELIARAGGEGRKSPQHAEGASARAIVLGTVLDGIPESIVVGLTLLSGEGLSVAVVAAVFLSNLPEAMAATTGFVAAGARPARILLLWSAVALVSATASAIGYAVLGDASSGLVAYVQAFAAGAILTMLADTMMPEAFEHGGRVAGLATTLGFVFAFGLSVAEQSV
ncbi:MAG TPA: ZIP family zinc transporter [Actinomycetota bacterium]|nr:ZIP family zinc transporter [Actinomycetota bacterium]